MPPETSINLLNVLTPIVPGEEAVLAEDLAQLPNDLFAPVPDVHVARWVRLGRFDAEPARKLRPSRMEYLLFTAAFNGAVVSLLEQMRLNIGFDLDRIWRHCVNFPGHDGSVEFRRYLEHNSLGIRQRFVAYDATVAEVRAALALRQQHIEFAIAAETLSDVELQQSFLSMPWSRS